MNIRISIKHRGQVLIAPIEEKKGDNNTILMITESDDIRPPGTKEMKNVNLIDLDNIIILEFFYKESVDIYLKALNIIRKNLPKYSETPKGKKRGKND